MDSLLEETDSTSLPPKATMASSQPEIKLISTSDDLSPVPPKSAVSKWLTTRKAYSNVAATEQAQLRPPEMEADTKAFKPQHAGVARLKQAAQSREERYHPWTSLSNKELSPPVSSASIQFKLIDRRVVKSRRKLKAPANEDNPSISRESQPTADEQSASSPAEKKPQKAKQYHTSELPLEGKADLSCELRPEAAAVERLERLIKDLQSRAFGIAQQMSRGTTKAEQKILQMQLFETENAIKGKQAVLRDYKMNHSVASVPREGSTDQISPASDNTTLLRRNFLTQLSLQEEPAQAFSPTPAPESQFQAPKQVALPTDSRGHRDSPPAAELEEQGELKARQSRDYEWTDISLSDVEEPLGQEEWEDDFALELIPRGAANNPFYPGLAR